MIAALRYFVVIVITLWISPNSFSQYKPNTDDVRKAILEVQYTDYIGRSSLSTFYRLQDALDELLSRQLLLTRCPNTSLRSDNRLFMGAYTETIKRLLVEIEYYSELSGLSRTGKSVNELAFFLAVERTTLTKNQLKAIENDFNRQWEGRLTGAFAGVSELPDLYDNLATDINTGGTNFLAPSRLIHLLFDWGYAE